MFYKQYDFVVFLDSDWDMQGNRNRQHFLIHEIAKIIEDKGKVLAIERPVCLVTGHFRQRSKFLRWFKRKKVLRQEAENLFVYTPFICLHNVLAASVPLLPKLNRFLMKWQVKRLLNKLSFRQETLVAWIYHPYQLEDVGLVNEKVLVYDIFDDYLSRDRNKQVLDNLKRREDIILPRADVVFVVSEKLLKTMEDRAKQVLLLPNGADIELFAKAMDAETEIPSEISVLSHPIIGFVGKVTERIDFELLVKLAITHSEWNLLFVGECDDDRKLLRLSGYHIFKNLPNVYFSGPKPYTGLPGYLKAFDVCVIPYNLDGQNPSCSPLKLYEYLATGKPIVSVDIPHVAHFKPLVRIARNADEFVEKVEDALAERVDKLRQQRFAAARQNSWKKRAERALEIIESTLDGKQS